MGTITAIRNYFESLTASSIDIHPLKRALKINHNVYPVFFFNLGKNTDSEFRNHQNTEANIRCLCSLYV